MTPQGWKGKAESRLEIPKDYQDSERIVALMKYIIFIWMLIGFIINLIHRRYLVCVKLGVNGKSFLQPWPKHTF